MILESVVILGDVALADDPFVLRTMPLAFEPFSGSGDIVSVSLTATAWCIGAQGQELAATYPLKLRETRITYAIGDAALGVLVPVPGQWDHRLNGLPPARDEFMLCDMQTTQPSGGAWTPMDLSKLRVIIEQGAEYIMGDIEGRALWFMVGDVWLTVLERRMDGAHEAHVLCAL